MIRRLPRSIPAPPDRPRLGDENHPMRIVTRDAVSDPGAWTPERATAVRAAFDALAEGWHTRWDEGRFVTLGDALARGAPIDFGTCVEVGSGSGIFTSWLAERFESVIALDLSEQMLRHAPPHAAPRVLADASALPVRSGSADAVVLVNMFLFAAEVDRVLARDGVVVWVNSMGDATPIYLPAEEVEAALPGGWDGVASDAGWGTWAVLRRSPP